MEPNDCDERVTNQDDSPAYVCSDNEGDSKRVTLHCCVNYIPCIGWTGEWWYKNVIKPNATFKRYPDAENSKVAWVFVNNTDYPIRYLCNISSSPICKKGSGYIDVQKGTVVF